jgi:cytochrome P450
MPLPVDVIARQLDVPRADRGRFRTWSEAISMVFDPAHSNEERDSVAPVIAELNDFLLQKRREKIAHPTEDIISVIAASKPEARAADGSLIAKEERLTDGEFLTCAQLLVVGGNENTTAGILLAVQVLARNPDLFAQLRREPALIRNFVEEVLRRESPAPGTTRCVTRDTVLGGTVLPKGSIVELRFAAANRDPREFRCPENFDLKRPNGVRHVSFGGGAHMCVGQMLARREMSCVIRTMCERMATVALDPQHEVRYRHMFHLRSPESLHLVFAKSTEPK